MVTSNVLRFFLAEVLLAMAASWFYRSCKEADWLWDPKTENAFCWMLEVNKMDERDFRNEILATQLPYEVTL